MVSEISAPEDVTSEFKSLAQGVDNFATLADASETYALFTLAAETFPDDSVTTFIVAAGQTQVLSAGLQAELTRQIMDGDFQLFNILQEVIANVSANVGNKSTHTVH